MGPRHTAPCATLVLVTAALTATSVRADDWSPLRGSIKNVRTDQGRLSILVEETPHAQLGKVVFHLTDKTRLIDSAGQSAAAADLKVGQRVSVYYGGGLAESKPPQGTANLIIIESGRTDARTPDGKVRELLGRGTSARRAEIARQIDFSREYVLYFHWVGAGDDALTFTTETGPLVVFTFTPGKFKNKVRHERVFALPKVARWRLVETFQSSRTPAATKISTAAELARTLSASP
jgi:hypothetical protein